MVVIQPSPTQQVMNSTTALCQPTPNLRVQVPTECQPTSTVTAPEMVLPPLLQNPTVIEQQTSGTSEPIPDPSSNGTVSERVDNTIFDHPMRLIRVHRTRVREDMLEIFSDPTILSSQLNVTIVDSQGNAERGAGSGVQREIFSMFLERYK